MCMPCNQQTWVSFLAASWCPKRHSWRAVNPEYHYLSFSRPLTSLQWLRYFLHFWVRLASLGPYNKCLGCKEFMEKILTASSWGKVSKIRFQSHGTHVPETRGFGDNTAVLGPKAMSVALRCGKGSELGTQSWGNHVPETREINGRLWKFGTWESLQRCLGKEQKTRQKLEC